MNKFIMTGLTGFILLCAQVTFADNIRITAINEFPGRANLTINSAQGREQTISLNQADIKMFTANYQYPAPIFIRTDNQFSKACDWSMPLVGKQTLQMLSINISKNPSTQAVNCLITRQQ